MVTTGGRGTASAPPSSPVAAASAISFCACSSKVITLVSAPKKRAISLASSASSVWLMVANTPRDKQTRDQILGADVELLRQILHANAFGDGDVPRDRLRLVRKRQPRRRNIALHRAFLHPARNVALSGTTRRTTRTAAWTGWPWRGAQRRSWAHTQRTRTRGRRPRGMHRTTFARTQRRTRTAWDLRTRTLKNRLTGHGTAGYRTRSDRVRRAEQASAAAPCKPAAVQSAEQSCAAAELWAQPACWPLARWVAQPMRPATAARLGP